MGTNGGSFFQTTRETRLDNARITDLQVTTLDARSLSLDDAPVAKGNTLVQASGTLTVQQVHSRALIVTDATVPFAPTYTFPSLALLQAAGLTLGSYFELALINSGSTAVTLAAGAGGSIVLNGLANPIIAGSNRLLRIAQTGAAAYQISINTL